MLDELDADDAECRRRVKSGRKIEDAFRSLVSASSFQLECASADLLYYNGTGEEGQP